MRTGDIGGTASVRDLEITAITLSDLEIRTHQEHIFLFPTTVLKPFMLKKTSDSWLLAREYVLSHLMKLTKRERESSEFIFIMKSRVREGVKVEKSR